MKRQVNKSELARFLKRFREFVGHKKSQVEARLPASDAKHPAWVPRNTKPNSLSRFEDCGTKESDESVAIDDARAVALAYQMPFMMLDALLSRVESAPYVVARFDDEFILPQEGLDQHQIQLGLYGLQCKYLIPEKRLSHCDVSIAFVRLNGQPGKPASTDCHLHPGDEVVYMLKGSARLLLPWNGMEVVLRPGSFMHYYAEQLHGMETEEEVEAVVFRFFQMERQGTRLKAMTSISELLPAFVRPNFKLDPGHRKVLREIIVPWLTQYMATPQWKAKDLNDQPSPERLVDPVGLSLMLREFSLQRGKWDIGSLVTKGGKDHWPTESTIRGILSGVDAPEIFFHQIDQLSQVFNISAPLFFPFFFPSVPRCVVVHDTAKDLATMPVDSRGTYLSPSRRLAGSDSSIAYLCLGPGQSSCQNSHPGFEMLVPLDGEISITIDGFPVFTAGPRCVVQFRSSISHRIENKTRQHVRSLLIRCYEVRGACP